MKIRILPLLCLLLFSGCPNPDEPENSKYRQDMRAFVQSIALRARGAAGAGFGIFPQNGCALTRDPDYLATINGSGNEDLFYGYSTDDAPTPANETDALLALLDPQVAADKLVLVVDYCTTQAYVDDSYARCIAHGFVPYCTTRELDTIVDNGHVPTRADSHDCQSWSDVKHFLYLINPQNYASATAMIAAIGATYYDLVVIDADFDGQPIAATMVNALKIKPDNKRRRVLAYMSIGEAENYRWYWQSPWWPGNPAWLGAENSRWKGNFAVAYWDPAWQAIISHYVDRVVAASFDGLYLDKIDEYEYWESRD